MDGIEAMRMEINGHCIETMDAFMLAPRLRFSTLSAHAEVDLYSRGLEAVYQPISTFTYRTAEQDTNGGKVGLFAAD
jgi:hypothetical protein